MSMVLPPSRASRRSIEMRPARELRQPRLARGLGVGIDDQEAARVGNLGGHPRLGDADIPIEGGDRRGLQVRRQRGPRRQRQQAHARGYPQET